MTGGKPTILQKDWQGMFEQLIWQDPAHIHFLGSISTETALGTIKPDAKAKPVFTNPDKGFSIAHMEMAANGAALYIADTWQHPSELYITRAGQPGMTRVTHSNPWMSDITLAKQEVIRYKAKDGLEIDGILVRPLNEEAGKRYPLITVVHGGPEAHYNNGWLTSYSTPAQTAAAEGYAVFLPNYRGSTGRGVDFNFSSQADPAGKEFDDVVDGIDHLINIGLVDKARVGVTGGSYGGYATGGLLRAIPIALPPASCLSASAMSSPNGARPISPSKSITSTRGSGCMMIINSSSSAARCIMLGSARRRCSSCTARKTRACIRRSRWSCIATSRQGRTRRWN